MGTDNYLIVRDAKVRYHLGRTYRLRDALAMRHSSDKTYQLSDELIDILSSAGNHCFFFDSQALRDLAQEIALHARKSKTLPDEEIIDKTPWAIVAASALFTSARRNPRDYFAIVTDACQDARESVFYVDKYNDMKRPSEEEHVAAAYALGMCPICEGICSR